MNRKVVVLLLICLLLTMAVSPAFACAGYDPCPDGPYGNGDINIDALGWYLILVEIFTTPWW